jgi:hypothetical protein
MREREPGHGTRANKCMHLTLGARLTRGLSLQAFSRIAHPRQKTERANKELKLTSVCPSFARAPGASGALTLAA